MAKRTFSLIALCFVALLSCSRQPDGLAQIGNVNIRLTFTPDEISADQGTAVATISVDSPQAIRLEDVKVATSAGFDKVGAMMATGRNRFSVSLVDLTDISLSPVKVTVQIGDSTQEGFLKIVPGAPDGLVVTLDSATISADVGEVGLTVQVKDKSANLAPGSITLETTAGVVSQLVMEEGGSYHAVLSGLVHTDDSPVKVTARVGEKKSEAVVQILAGELDHFTIEPVANTLVVGEFSPFRVSARDRNENLVTAFESYVNVNSSRGAGDIEVKFADSIATFTRNFVLGTSLEEQFRVRTAAVSPGIRLVVSDNSGHTGQSNLFVVNQAPANQLSIQTYSGFNLIVSADGCVKPTVAGDDCEIDAVKNSNDTWAYSPLSTKLEMRLRRYMSSPDEPDSASVLVGGRGGEIVLSMTDVDGNVYDQNSPHTGPYLGPIDDELNGYYSFNIYNLRDQEKSPYIVTARFVNLVAEAEVSIVPGDTVTFAFTEIPSQKAIGTAINPNFLTSVSARDAWGNQVFAFQDAVEVFQKVGTNEVFLTKSPPAMLGGTFAFAVSVPTLGASQLIARHGGLDVEGASNTFQVFGTEHVFTTNFLVLLPGQYGPGLTPPLGQLDATQASPTNLTANKPFEILLIARTAGGTQIPTRFAGRVLLGANGSGIEVIDDSCAQDSNLNDNPELGTSLTPPFIYTNIGTSFFPPNEDVCYVTVRMTAPSSTASISLNPFFTSTFQPNPFGMQSTTFPILQGEMKSIRISTIPTPQLTSAVEPEAGKKTSFTVQALDLAGNQTNNTVGCATLTISDVKGYLRHAGGVAFDSTGVATVEDVWYQANLSATDRESNQILASCSLQINTASNVFDLVSEGVGCLAVYPPSGTVRAHEEFTFNAQAFEDAACTIPAVNVNYAFTMTDTTGTMFPGKTAGLTNGVITGQRAYIDRAQDNVRICLRGAGLLSCSAPFNVEVGHLNYFTFDMTGFPNSVTVGSDFTLKVEAKDAGHNPVPDFKGRIYLSNSYNTAKFVLPSDTLSTTAKVLSVDEGSGNYHLFFCNEQDTATTTCTPSLIQLRVRFSDISSGDYLSISDGKGHTGISLPHLYNAVFPPVSSFAFSGDVCGAPVVPVDIYRETYFNLCVRALALGEDGVTYFKRDYHSTDVGLASGGGAVVFPPSITFSAGLARAQVLFDDMAPGSTNLYVNVQPADTLSFNTYALPTTYALDSTAPPALVKTGQKFYLDLSVTPSARFNGSLRVTDTTGTIVPECGPSESGNCGFVDEAGRAITGNFSSGLRRQWFSIPAEYFGVVICLENGRGVKECLPPVDVEGNLDHFEVRPVANLLARGTSYALAVTAVDADGITLVNFNAPLQLTYTGGTVSPTVLPAAFVNGVLNTTFQITNGGTSTGRLVVTFPNSSKTGQSNSFTVQERALNRFVWDPIVGDKPGYVDFDVRVEARDQFDSQFAYSGKINFSATNGFAVRPTQSTNFTAEGVWAGKIALDGAPLQTSVIATQQGGTVSGASNAVTVTTSSIFSFVATMVANPVQNCNYALSLQARDSGGAIVNGFSGRVRLRWGNPNATLARYNTTNPGANEDLVVVATGNQLTPNFVGGQLSPLIQIQGQPPSFLGTLQNYINVYIEGTGIEGWTQGLNVGSPGTCPP